MCWVVDEWARTVRMIRALPHQSPRERLPQRTALPGDWCGTSVGRTLVPVATALPDRLASLVPDDLMAA